MFLIFLERNHFNGEIPTSLSQIDRLSVLDLSSNDLSGKIPSGTQLQDLRLLHIWDLRSPHTWEILNFVGHHYFCFF